MFRTLLTLGMFLVLLGAGTSTAADGSGRPDGRLLPDGADIHPATPVRPDDRGDRFTPGSLSEPAIEARNAVTPVVVRVDDGATTSFDWLAALIGGLVVAGVALAMGGLLVLRRHGAIPAR